MKASVGTSAGYVSTHGPCFAKELDLLFVGAFHLHSLLHPLADFARHPTHMVGDGAVSINPLMEPR